MLERSTARPSACRLSARRAAASTWSQTSAGIGGVPLEPMALANDAAVHDGEIVGDPTEAALVVLAAKGGVDGLDGQGVGCGA